jgi:DNA-binding response OmpR family regulator
MTETISSGESGAAGLAAAFRREAGDRLLPPLLLVIDDDRMVGRFITHAAEECGFRASRTTSAEAFSRSLLEQMPDAVAVDLCVPGVDGIEIIRLLAEEKYQGSVIIVSGLDQRILDAALRLGEAMGLNMAEPLAKPFRLDALAQRLQLAAPGMAE